MEPTIRWVGEADGHLELLDQTRLPHQQAVLSLKSVDGVIAAIRRLSVRGAPAIGVAAAYGVLIGLCERRPGDPDAFLAVLEEVSDRLIAARPTAVNLSWAVERMRAVGRVHPDAARLLTEARAIHNEDIELCAAMGRHGATLIPDGGTVLTHCNTGRLATSGDGTALALLFEAWRQGRRFRVLADETRPLLQGSRLTALELAEEGIPVEVIADGAAAGLIARGEIDLVITGADRVAANGDTANKVGTYGLGLACRAHQVPIWVVAPSSTFDLGIQSGAEIPIEERDPAEVLELGGQRIAAQGVGARNPAFDVTPAELLTGLVTDRGLISPIHADSIKARLG